MNIYLKKLFILPVSADKLRIDQVKEAALLALDHRAQAEHHLALAEMYEKRAERLQPLSELET